MLRAPLDRGTLNEAATCRETVCLRSPAYANLWAYAGSPVPVYLLIDRFDEHGPTASLFTEPQNGAYKHAVRVAFGDELRLPEPFALTLDTGSFPH
ncbi:hypothetical protein ACFYM0_32130 [Streptomyces sp. NPDC006487]|uniref:hypothetical protein n=1 Tax=Streptomyces sp. NPDC006487 TaxID=3364748 RepID=UPI003684C0C7